MGAVTACLIVVVFCFILLWHNPLFFWNDDYEVSILPVFADVARSWSEGHLPLLSPYSWVCSNLAGEFQYGTFSVFVNAAVVLIWKFPLAFAQQAAALSITHLFVLAAGAFLLGRGRGLSVPLSVLVSLVGTLNGWIVCWGATDWFGALGAFAWLPWAWWASEKALEPGRRGWRFLWPAPFVYLVVTGGFPYTVVMLGLLLAWLSIKSLVETRKILSVGPMLLGVGLGLGMSAPAWLALLDYVHGSAREVQPGAAHWQWLVPPSALPGFILPCWTVNWADFSTRYLPHTAVEMACGLVPPAVLGAAFLTGGRQFVRRMRWELLLLLFVLLVSMLPSAGVFRWSFRWLPLIHLVLGLCAAEAARALPKPGQSAWASAGVLALVMVALGATVMWMAYAAGRYAFPLTWIFLGLAVLWAFSDILQRGWRGRDWVLPSIAFLALLATYLCLPTNGGVPKFNFSQDLTKPAPLDPQRLYLAVYSPAEYAYRREYKEGPVGQIARPGSTPMWAQLRFINGYSPILAAGVAREFKFFIHGEIDGEVGKYLVENQSGPAGILEQLGVDGMVIAEEIPVEPSPADWQLEVSNDEGRVFHHRGASYPHVRSVNWIDSRPNDEFSTATISEIRDERNSIACVVHVPNGDKAALLTVSRPYFRGYQARLGGKKLKVDSYRGLFPTVEVPPGSQGQVVLAYRPWWLIWGGGLSVLCALIWMSALVAARKN
jgi:hypothetical protein